MKPFVDQSSVGWWKELFCTWNEKSNFCT